MNAPTISENALAGEAGPQRGTLSGAVLQGTGQMMLFSCLKKYVRLHLLGGRRSAQHPRKLAGLTKFGNVTLRWGVSDDSDFLEWVYSVAPTNTAPPTAWCGMLEGCRFLPAASAPA